MKFLLIFEEFWHSIWEEILQVIKYNPEVHPKLISENSDFSGSNYDEFDEFDEFEEFDEIEDDEEQEIEIELVPIEKGVIGLQELQIDEFDQILKEFKEIYFELPENSIDSTDLYLFLVVLSFTITTISSAIIIKSYLFGKVEEIDDFEVSIDPIDSNEIIETPVDSPAVSLAASLIDSPEYDLDDELIQPLLQPPAYEQNLDSSPLNLSYLSDDLENSDEIIGPFTLDSSKEVEVLTIGGSSDLSISIKKTHNEEVDEKLKVGLKFKKIDRKPLTDLNMKENSKELNMKEDVNSNLSSNFDSKIKLELESDPALDLKEAMNIPIVNTILLPSITLEPETIKPAEDYECDDFIEEDCNTLKANSGSTILELPPQPPNTPVSNKSSVFKPSPTIDSNFDDLLTCAESIQSPFIETSLTPEVLSKKEPVLRIVSNDKKSTPSKIPILSPNKSLIKASPLSKSDPFKINDEIEKFLDLKEKNIELFLNELFGEDPEIIIDDEFISSLTENDIDRILLIYKGKETSENWKERYDHFDILIGHLRTHLPIDHYDYFQSKIFENLDQFLEIISTKRSLLLNKIIIFIRDIVYFGNSLTDEEFIKLFHALIPLTKTSQISRYVNNLTFKSLCLMIQSIDYKSFISKFESIFDKFLLDKKLKGEKYTCLFIIKFYIISNFDNFNEDQLSKIIENFIKLIDYLCIDGYQKTRMEIIEIYLILLKKGVNTELLTDYYNNLSNYLKLKVPKPE